MSIQAPLGKRPQSLPSAVWILVFGILSFASTYALATTYYVAPTGSDYNAGTITSPFATLQKAHGLAVAGDTIYMRGGTYAVTAQTTLTRSGVSGNPINIFAYPGEVPVIDAIAMTQAGYYALRLNNSAWWHIKGLEIKNGPEGGFMITNSSNSIIENNNIHHNGHLSQWEGNGLEMNQGSANNLILNNDSHHNRGAVVGNADGFHIGATGTGNVLRGNRSWRNSDDGFDTWDGAPLTLDGNQSWENGYDDNLQPLGDGNAFKLGGQSLSTSSGGHLVKNNLAWNNRQNGFDENSARRPSTLYNNIAWKNGNYNYSFWDQPNTFRNNISLGSVGVAASGSATSNSWTLPVSVATADFVSVSYTAVPPARNADGSLPATGFLNLAAGSNLIDKGTDVGLAYTGSAPDLGAYEYAAPATAPTSLGIQAAQAGSPSATGIAQIVEYHNSAQDDYFITADPAEQQALDAAAQSGAVWSRTGMTFYSGGSVSAYRFIYRSSTGTNTHFYTVNTSEQSSLLANNSSWVLESPAAFRMTAANANQTCPAGTIPVYRAAQEQTGSHRFTTLQSAINEVLGRGWTNEGVAFCAPQ